MFLHSYSISIFIGIIFFAKRWGVWLAAPQCRPSGCSALLGHFIFTQLYDYFTFETPVSKIPKCFGRFFQGKAFIDNRL